MATVTKAEEAIDQMKALRSELAKAMERLDKQGASNAEKKKGEQFFAAAMKSVQHGGVNGVYTEDGQFTPVVVNPAKRLFPDGDPRQKAWRGMLKGLSILHGKNSRHTDRESAMKMLFEDSVPDPNSTDLPPRKWAKAFGSHMAEYSAVEKVALAESSGTAGGYVVPPQFSNQLLSMAVEESIFAQMASKHPMTSLTAQLPYLDIVTPNGAGVSNLLAGIIPTWTAEAAQRTESEPRFRQLELKAYELSMIAVASNTLLADDAVGLDSLLTQLFPKAIAWFTDYAYFQGNGVGKPTGVLNANAKFLVNRASPARFQYQDAANMVQRLYGPSAFRKKKVAWCMHPFMLNQLLQMYDGANRPVWIPLSSGAVEFPAQVGGREWSAGKLLGYDVYLTEKLPPPGTPGDVMLLDFEAYILGDRQQLEIEVSPWPLFQFNQMMYRLVWRGDGQSWLGGPITLADGTSLVSPFIILN